MSRVDIKSGKLSIGLETYWKQFSNKHSFSNLTYGQTYLVIPNNVLVFYG